MTRLSNRQFPMLQTFSGGSYFSINQAKHFDQRPFRSMLIQKWIVFIPTKGFRITNAGKIAWHEFNSTDISRKDPTKPLTAYFDERIYGISKAKTHSTTNNRELSLRP